MGVYTRLRDAASILFKGEDPRKIMARTSRVGGMWFQPLVELPGDSAGLAFNERTNPTLGSAIENVAKDVAATPLILVRQSPDRKKHKPEWNHPAYELYQHINAIDTPYIYWVSNIKDLICYGNHYDHVLFDTDNGKPPRGSIPANPVSIWRLPAHKTKPVPDASERIVTKYIWTQPDGDEVEYGVDEIIHFKTSNIWSPYIGMAPIDRARGALALEHQMDVWNYSRFLNNIPANLIFFTDKKFVNQAEMDKVQQEIMDRFSGSEKAGKPLIMQGENWEVKPIERASEEEIAYLQGKQFLKAIYLMVTHCPPAKVGDYSSAFRSNAKEQDLGYWEDTIAGWHQLILDVLNSIVLPRYWPSAQRLRFRYDYSGVKALAQSEYQQAQVQEILARNAIVSANEARSSMGLDERPEPEADKLMHNGSPLGEKKPEPVPGATPPGGPPVKPEEEPRDTDPDATRKEWLDLTEPILTTAPQYDEEDDESTEVTAVQER